MTVSMTKVSTENASSYLRKLCQHWSHKFPVSFDAQHGTIDLAVGKCILDAETVALKVNSSFRSRRTRLRCNRLSRSTSNDLRFARRLFSIGSPRWHKPWGVDFEEKDL